MNSTFYNQILNSIGVNSNSLEFASNLQVTTIPNNCFDILICANGDFTVNTNNDSLKSSKGIFGLSKKSVSVVGNSISSGTHINLLPEHMCMLTSIPLGEISGELLDISEIFKEHTNELLDISVVPGNSNLLQQFFKKVLKKYHDPNLIRAMRITRLIMETNGNLTIKEISDQTFLTKRTLQRLFYKYVGLSPKAYSKIVRFRHISQVYYMGKFTEKQSLYDLLIAFGYYDYSHFIHDCNQITGLSPTEYFKNLNPTLSLLYNKEQNDFSYF